MISGTAAVGLIDPADAWPGDDLDPASIASAAQELRLVGRQVAHHGRTVARHWQRLARSYEAPEVAQLLSSVTPITTDADVLDSNTARSG